VPITYMNTKEQTYYLHQGKTKTGKPTYYFSMKRAGQLTESIPEGFKIYEHPNAQVFLRRIPPKIITDEERQIVEEGMRDAQGVSDYKIDVRDKAIIIYTADQDRHEVSQIFQDVSPTLSENMQLMALLHQTGHYSSILQFILTDKQRRLFLTQRYCSRGSVHNWHNVGKIGTLAHLVKWGVKYLGKKSCF
jgi:hypothetical protein